MKFLSEINDAGKVKIADVAGNFTADNVEGALAELAASVPLPILVKQGTSYTAVELAEGQIGFLYT